MILPLQTLGNCMKRRWHIVHCCRATMEKKHAPSTICQRTSIWPSTSSLCTHFQHFSIASGCSAKMTNKIISFPTQHDSPPKEDRESPEQWQEERILSSDKETRCLFHSDATCHCIVANACVFQTLLIHSSIAWQRGSFGWCGIHTHSIVIMELPNVTTIVHPMNLNFVQSVMDFLWLQLPGSSPMGTKEDVCGLKQLTFLSCSFFHFGWLAQIIELHFSAHCKSSILAAKKIDGMNCVEQRGESRTQAGTRIIAIVSTTETHLMSRAAWTSKTLNRTPLNCARCS